MQSTSSVSHEESLLAAGGLSQPSVSASFSERTLDSTPVPVAMSTVEQRRRAVDRLKGRRYGDEGLAEGAIGEEPLRTIGENLAVRGPVQQTEYRLFNEQGSSKSNGSSKGILNLQTMEDLSGSVLDFCLGQGSGNSVDINDTENRPPNGTGSSRKTLKQISGGLDHDNSDDVDSNSDPHVELDELELRAFDEDFSDLEMDDVRSAGEGADEMGREAGTCRRRIGVNLGEDDTIDWSKIMRTEPKLGGKHGGEREEDRHTLGKQEPSTSSNKKESGRNNKELSQAQKSDQNSVSEDDNSSTDVKPAEVGTEVEKKEKPRWGLDSIYLRPTARRRTIPPKRMCLIGLGDQCSDSDTSNSMFVDNWVGSLPYEVGNPADSATGEQPVSDEGRSVPDNQEKFSFPVDGNEKFFPDEFPSRESKEFEGNNRPSFLASGSFDSGGDTGGGGGGKFSFLSARGAGALHSFGAGERVSSFTPRHGAKQEFRLLDSMKSGDDFAAAGDAFLDDLEAEAERYEKGLVTEVSKGCESALAELEARIVPVNTASWTNVAERTVNSTTDHVSVGEFLRLGTCPLGELGSSGQSAEGVDRPSFGIARRRPQQGDTYSLELQSVEEPNTQEEQVDDGDRTLSLDSASASIRAALSAALTASGLTPSALTEAELGDVEFSLHHTEEGLQISLVAPDQSSLNNTSVVVPVNVNDVFRVLESLVDVSSASALATAIQAQTERQVRPRPRVREAILDQASGDTRSKRSSSKEEVPQETLSDVSSMHELNTSAYSGSIAGESVGRRPGREAVTSCALVSDLSKDGSFSHSSKSTLQTVRSKSNRSPAQTVIRRDTPANVHTGSMETARRGPSPSEKWTTPRRSLMMPRVEGKGDETDMDRTLTVPMAKLDLTVAPDTPPTRDFGNKNNNQSRYGNSPNPSDPVPTPTMYERPAVTPQGDLSIVSSQLNFSRFQGMVEQVCRSTPRQVDKGERGMVIQRAVPVLTPKELTFSEVCPVGASLEHALELTNQSEDDVVCRLSIDSCSANGREITGSVESVAFAVPPCFTLPGKGMLRVPVAFRPRESGRYLGQIRVQLLAGLEEMEGLVLAPPALVTVRACAEVPQVELFAEDPNTGASQRLSSWRPGLSDEDKGAPEVASARSLDLGCVPWTCWRASPVSLVNGGRCPLRVRVALDAGSHRLSRLSLGVRRRDSNNASAMDESSGLPISVTHLELLPGGEMGRVEVFCRPPDARGAFPSGTLDTAVEISGRLRVHLESSRGEPLALIHDSPVRALIGSAHLWTPRDLDCVQVTAGGQATRVPLHNAGSLPLDVLLRVGGPEGRERDLAMQVSVKPDRLVIEPGATEMVEVFYNPQRSAGVSKKGVLYLLLEPDGPMYELSLLCHDKPGDVPLICSNKSHLMWAGVPLGKEDRQRLYLKNVDQQQVTLNLEISSGKDNFQFVDSEGKPCGTSRQLIAPSNVEVPVYVAYSPTKCAYHQGKITIRINPPSDSNYVLGLFGYGGSADVTTLRCIELERGVFCSQTDPRGRVRLTLHNQGTRSAWVRAAVLPAGSRGSSLGVSVSPAAFLLDKLDTKVVTVSFPEERGQSVQSLIKFFYGDEILRRHVRKRFIETKDAQATRHIVEVPPNQIVALTSGHIAYGDVLGYIEGENDLPVEPLPFQSENSNWKKTLSSQLRRHLDVWIMPSKQAQDQTKMSGASCGSSAVVSMTPEKEICVDRDLFQGSALSSSISSWGVELMRMGPASGDGYTKSDVLASPMHPIDAQLAPSSHSLTPQVPLASPLPASQMMERGTEPSAAWSLSPVHIDLPLRSNATERLRVENGEDRLLKFNVSCVPAGQLIVTPMQFSVEPGRSQSITVSPSPALIWGPLTEGQPWTGSLVVQCEGASRAVQVTVGEKSENRPDNRADKIVEAWLRDQSHASGTVTLSGVHEGERGDSVSEASESTVIQPDEEAPGQASSQVDGDLEPSREGRLLRVRPDDVTFLDTVVGECTDAVVELWNPSNLTVTWKACSRTSAYLEEDAPSSAQSDAGSTPNGPRTELTPFTFGQKSGHLSPDEVASVRVAFKPRLPGLYTQQWELEVMPKGAKAGESVKIVVIGKGVASLRHSYGPSRMLTMTQHSASATLVQLASSQVSLRSLRPNRPLISVKPPYLVFAPYRLSAAGENKAGVIEKIRVTNRASNVLLPTRLRPLQPPFYLTKMSADKTVEIKPCHAINVPVAFKPVEPGRYQACLIVEAEGETPLLVQLEGHAVE